MGCVVSKKAAPVTPATDSIGGSWEVTETGEVTAGTLWSRVKVGSESGESGRESSIDGGSSRSSVLGNFKKHLEGAQAAAGWPSWLSSVAGEAIQGWVPLKADTFEKLEKIGQGTYSSVFKARNLDSGKFVALKKVQFDNFEPESVRFMAREILILRRLDHPNVVKLEGLITSRLSCTLYLVFEYVEHDLAGLISSSEIQFSESQVKCYMYQLLSGLQHCHSRGVMHRDIKSANILVGNDGIVKVADFGLANFFNPDRKHPLTSRVVTLWYRAPEILLGSMYYDANVDLWSVGCVFGELFLGKPILQGRTEVEQLHKIFRLCGSPPDEYWKRPELPHASLSRPQHPYENCLREIFRNLPTSAFVLLATFLSVEPYKRGTASAALTSEYFKTRPYACEPSSLPEYPPTKEIDAKRREAYRKKVGGSRHELEATRRSSLSSRAPQEANNLHAFATNHEESRIRSQEVYDNDVIPVVARVNGDSRTSADTQPISKLNPLYDARRTKYIYQEDPLSGPLRISAPSGFAWANKRSEDNLSTLSFRQFGARDHTSNGLKTRNFSQANYEDVEEVDTNLKRERINELSRREMLRQWTQSGHRDSSNVSDLCYSQRLSRDHLRDSVLFKHRILGDQDKGAKADFSGHLLSHSCKVNEFLERNDHHTREAIRRSWLQRGGKPEE